MDDEVYLKRKGLFRSLENVNIYCFKIYNII